MPVFGNSGGSRVFGDPTSQNNNNNQDNLQRQIDNAKFRLEQSGVNTNKDERNWFEKATNLPEDQNWFFDTLDILGRPFQAVSNPIEGAMNDSGKSVGKEIWEGFSGQDKVYGSDLLDSSGWKTDRSSSFGEKAAHWTTGFGLDVALDPLNLLGVGPVRGAASAGARAAGNAARKTGSGVFNKLPSNAQSGLSTMGEGVKDVGRGVNQMFGGKYAGLTAAERETAQRFDNSAKYMDEEITRDTADLYRNLGGDPSEIGKLQEASLQINKDPKQLVDDFIKNRGYSSNIVGGEYKKFVDDFNDYFKSLPDTKSRVGKVNDRIKKETSKMNQITSKYGRENFITGFKSLVDDAKKNGTDLNKAIKNQDNMKAAGFTKDDFRFLKDVRTYLKAGKAVKGMKGELDKLQNPLVHKSLEQGKGFETVNRKPRITNNNVNTDDFIESISPKKSFNEMVGVNANQVRPVMEDLLSNGKVQVSKDDPSVEEIKRLLKEDVNVRKQRNATLTLNNPEKYNKPLDEMTFTDTIDNVNVPRPERKLTDDEDMVQAARLLTQGNDEIRNLADSFGIDVNNMAGYMKHILSRETEKAKNKVSSGKSKIGGNKSVVRSRNLDGSVLDINERLGKEFMDPNAYFSSAIGRKKLSEYIHAEGFKREVLDRFGRKYEGGSVGKNEVIIKPENYQFYQTDGGQLAIKKGEEYVVSKPMKQALDNWKRKIDDEGINAFVKSMDFLNNQFKKLALFSPAFHIRNIVGSNFNMWISGMNGVDLTKYNTLAVKDLRNARQGLSVGSSKQTDLKAGKYYDEFRKQGLYESSIFNNDFQFNDSRKALENKVNYDKKSLAGKAVNRVVHPFDSSKNVGMEADRISRYALYRWAREKKGMSPEKAADKVRETLFDYSDLSQFEKGLKHAVPFYTWMRKNAEFQIKNMISQPQKYEQMERIRQDGLEQAGMEDENLPDWLKSSMAMPVSGDGQGNGNLLGLNLPMSDVARMADSEYGPLNTLVEGLSPYAKLPFELTTNYDSFRGQPIEEFEGQRGNLFGMDVPKRAEHAINSLLGSVGTVNRKLEKDELDPVNDILLGGLNKENDPEKNEKFRQIQELEKFQDRMRRMEQETGYRPKTLQELQEMGITRN